MTSTSSAGLIGHARPSTSSAARSKATPALPPIPAKPASSLALAGQRRLRLKRLALMCGAGVTAPWQSKVWWRWVRQSEPRHSLRPKREAVLTRNKASLPNFSSSRTYRLRGSFFSIQQPRVRPTFSAHCPRLNLRSTRANTIMPSGAACLLYLVSHTASQPPLAT